MSKTKTRAKSTRKTKPVSTPVPDTFPKGQTISPDEVVVLVPHKGKYDEAVCRVRGLTDGESVRFAFSKAADARKAIRGLVSAMQARDVHAPEGYGYYKQVGTDNSLIVTLKPRKSRA